MAPAVLRIALVTGALALWPAVPSVLADAGQQPSGQFQPSRSDRDGDGIPDASDCAPDDPTRPTRSGAGAHCAGAPGSGVQAASRPSSDTTSDAARAGRAAGGKVAVVHGLALPGVVSTYRLVHAGTGSRTFVFVADDSCALRVTPTLLDARGHATRLATRSHAAPSGSAFAVRVTVGTARDVRLALVVVDKAGNRHRITQTLRLGRP